MKRRPLVAETNEHDCSECGFVIERGEQITNLSAGPAHVACFGKMLPPEREYATRGWRSEPSFRTRKGYAGVCS